MVSILSIFDIKHLNFVVILVVGSVLGQLLAWLSHVWVARIQRALDRWAATQSDTINPDIVSAQDVLLIPRFEHVFPYLVPFLGILCVLKWPGYEAYVWLCFMAMCLLLGSIDGQTGILPNTINATLLLTGLAWRLGVMGQGSLSGVVAQVDFVWAMALGYGLPLGVALLYRRLRNVTPMGLGDAKMLAGLGVWLGLEGLAGVVMISTVSACVWLTGVWYQKKYKHRRAIALGPFLAFGAIVMVMWDMGNK